MNILIFFIILLVLVLVHEFGHFFAAKRFKIRVDEFGFGFPPKIFGFKKGETEYTFNLLPLGGFVKIFGENPNDLSDQTKLDLDYERSFISKPKYKQAIVLLGGVLANFLLAWLLFSFSFMSGLPASVGSQPEGYSVENPRLVIISTLPNSPAEKAGLKPGDEISSVYVIDLNKESEELKEKTPEALRSFVMAHQDAEIVINFIRDGGDISEFVTLRPSKENGETASIGVAIDQVGIVKLPFLRAFWEGLKLNLVVTKGTILGIFNLIKDSFYGNASLSSVTGPVGLVGIIGSAYQLGIVYLLSFTAFISINLAIINLIPFPALDGGRLLFLLIEKIKGSPLNPKIVGITNTVGFGILIILMLFVTYNDIIKLF